MQFYSFDIDSLPISVAIYKKDGNDFIIQEFNKVAQATENIKYDKLLGRKLTEVFPSVKASGFFDALVRVDTSSKKEVLETNLYEDARIDGWRRNEVVKLSDGTVAVFYADCSLEKKLEACNLKLKEQLKESQAHIEQLKTYAHYDLLTGLANRSLFIDRLSHMINQRRSNDQYSAVFFIDLDHFKEVNDTWGHATGDEMLKLVSKAFQSVLRKDDTLARIGGDEFSVLLENINSPLDAGLVAQKILDTLKAPITIGVHQLYITASIGIAIAPDDAYDAETLLRFADMAMYNVKEHGKNNYAFYKKDFSNEAFERVLIENDLRNALDNKEFILYYQPQINVLNDKVIGAEALLRWNHPQKGIILPLNFIPIAESSGQFNRIGSWVIKQAMEDIIKWKANNFNIETISINLSVKQLKDKTLITTIENSLEETGCNPGWIEFEITEGYAMSDHHTTMTLLQEISDIGFKISIDDFGTGYSSLGHLKDSPVQKLKIDQSFMKNIPGDPNDEAVVAAVIMIAKSMNIEIAAEGVESTPQQEFLVKHGCLLSQGFLYTEPLPKKEFEAYLELTLS